MTRPSKRTLLQVLAILVALLFAAGDSLARGGGGRGGGGGQKARGGGGAKRASASKRSGGQKRSAPRKISNRGPASGGLGTVKKGNKVGKKRPVASAGRQPAKTRPSGGRQLANARPAGQRPGANHPDRPARPDRPDRGDRVANQQDRVADRQDRRDDIREDRQDRREDIRNDRQEFREDRWDDRAEFRDDRQEFYENRWEHVDWNEVYIYDGDEWEWNAGRWLALSLGTAVTVSAFNSMRSQPGCNFFETLVDDTTYYRCGSTWYVETMSGSDLRYLAVEPPPGY